MEILFRTVCDRLARLVRVAVVVLAVVMLVALSLQVVMRYGFGRPLTWSEELAVACFGWAMLLAIAVGVRDRIHVRMELLVDLLPECIRLLLERLIALAIAGAGSFLAWSGWNYTADSGGLTSAAMAYPMAWLYGSAPVCGALIAMFGLEHALFGAPPARVGVPEARADSR
jgi:TRAP-type transport system small permease protein